MDVQAIKAELYDLQGHVCNGRLTVRQDGRREPGDKSCSGCDRIVELHGQLREAAETAGNPHVGNVDETVKELRAAGLDAWDQVDDPEAELGHNQNEGEA